ncbi:Dihydrolipoyllysine-residue succinyltransferase component of 2-oxoglutarate dehydrogenase complex [Posidoniimonas corsicana]|uniref:Dihydrolipoyllysine-residue succinyltransferase component of 2-oxoglutarate dehydrogenase complex n=1 Tax=Posidoniimonas corsicana TaxID=1938618 RepID=A0A5C5VCP8_9BACT|nr:2-oxoglutarate dehydrogenase complex dihydrolipoyllysine-residue succinyltransferase [Posidoniimonas corsicana]TWT35629.1 Dihydrolipoyllysine-residue succinyltransferase component of 2-oxoglutarate dehydrogenase complex [Posidoniimonas corsicana]
MSIELRIPEVGESIREVQIGAWLHKEGDSVQADEGLVELESEKASLELPAPRAGVLTKILKQEGESVGVGEVVGYLEEGREDGDSEQGPSATEGEERDDREAAPANHETEKGEGPSAEAPAPPSKEGATAKAFATPSARRELRRHGLELEDIEASGPRIRGEDVRQWVKEHENHRPAGDDRPRNPPGPEDHRPLQQAAREELVRMSPIRRRIADRLVQAQHQAALLTTFNEIDMSAVKDLRKAHGERFQHKHGVKLGYMSFFVKALVDALKLIPELNAEIRGDEIAYRNYHHIGVAIGGEKGLVVPVIRHAERLSFAQIEHAIGDFANRANSGDLSPDELTGGTFTISNGGVYGSLLSTPIVNPPQSGVLGMHAIEDRPIARNGEVIIRPMMYVALTYDHRIVDGRESVTFLRRIKEAIEDPARMLIEV